MKLSCQLSIIVTTVLAITVLDMTRRLFIEISQDMRNLIPSMYYDYEDDEDGNTKACPDEFEQYGEYCFLIDEHLRNQTSSAAYCAQLMATLSYPITDLDTWQLAIFNATTNLNRDRWSGARQQGDGTYTWPDGTQVQKEAWEPGEPRGYYCSDVNGDGYLHDYHCSYTRGTLCQACDLDELTMDVVMEGKTIEIVPMCVNGSHYNITMDDHELELSPGITQIVDVTSDWHEVCINTYDDYGGMLGNLCLKVSVLVCPEGFMQYEDYCFLWNNNNGQGRTQMDSTAYCNTLVATLPYPIGDFHYWQKMIQDVTSDIDWDGDAWSGATLQSDEGWIWLDGTQVQNNAWNDGEPNGNGSCSRFEGSSGILYDSVCSDTQPTLCQVVPAPPAPLMTIIYKTTSSLHVSWTTDSNVIGKYVVTWTSPTGESLNKKVNYDETDLNITMLQCNTEYKVSVTAYSDVNNFAISHVVKDTTNDEVPGKPKLMQIIPDESEPTKLVISWINSEYNCTGGLRNYHITWQTDYYSWSHNTDDGITTNYNIRPLLPDTKYIVGVAARSHMGIVGNADSQAVNTTSSIEREKRCPSRKPFPEKYPLYNWPDTDCGFVNKSCPNVMLGSATWLCDCDGKWVDLPDLSNCHNLDLSGWNDIFNSSNEPAGDSLGKLASNISSDEISTGDIQDLVEILDASSTRHSSDMTNASIDDQFILSIGYLNGILNVSDIILDNVEVWHGFPREQMVDQATNLQMIIGDASVSMANVITLDDNIEFRNFSKIGVKVEKHNSFHYENSTNNTYMHQFFDDTWIRIPPHLEEGPSANTIMISVLSFQNLHCILNTIPQCDKISDETMFPITVVSSPIMGVTVNGEKWTSPDNQSQILAAFDNTYIQNGYTGTNVTCVFWNNFIKDWDTEGCQLVSTDNPKQPICSCDHLTNLAVIMDVTGKISIKYDDSLTIITRIGCPISIVCLFLSMIVLGKIINQNNTLKTAHATDIIHLNLCFCLLVALITLIAGLDATANIAACAIVAFVLHYFFLASFCWMGLEAANIGYFFILKHETVLTRIRYQHLSAYGLPAFVVVVTLISTGGVGYGTENYCWLNTENGVIWALVAPASIILGFNMIIIIWVLRIITAEAEQKVARTHAVNQSVTKVRDRLAEEERREAQGNVKRLLMLTVMLGPTWLLGFISSYFGSLFLMGLFTILNSMQGAMIFALLIIVKKRRRDILLNDFLHLDKLKEFIMHRTSLPILVSYKRNKSNDIIALNSDYKNSEQTLDTSIPSMATNSREVNDKRQENKPEHEVTYNHQANNSEHGRGRLGEHYDLSPVSPPRFGNNYNLREKNEFDHTDSSTQQEYFV